MAWIIWAAIPQIDQARFCAKRSHSQIFWHPRDGQESPRTASCPFPTAPKKKSHQHLNPQTLIGVEVLQHEAR
ncbi:hypothetical protein [Coleofasciculus sp. F4-SAH-05]|uniref:hypothetical protein n=1 Tax=Coleofasciculus sp. F4-SAH-05 TaxID=3069525 RepID=UPI003302E6FE